MFPIFYKYFIPDVTYFTAFLVIMVFFKLFLIVTNIFMLIYLYILTRTCKWAPEGRDVVTFYR